MTRWGTCMVAVLTVLALAAAAGCGGDRSHGTRADPASAVQPTRPSAGAPGAANDEGDATSGGAPAPAGEAAVLPPEEALVTAVSHPVEDPYYPATSNPEVDVLHYYLELSWRDDILTGEATVTFRAATTTDTVRLDLSRALQTSRVLLDEAPILFDHPGDGLMMATGPLAADSQHTLTIDYQGSPQPTPAPSSRSDTTEGLGWQTAGNGTVYMYQEPYGAFTWYPVNDHPSDEALYDASITTYDGDVAVFNGSPTSTRTVGAATTSAWRLDEPAASYLVTLAIGPYSEHVVASPGGMDISYWLMPRDAGLLPALSDEGGRAFDWLVKHAGPYPFSTLGVVVVGGASAMETQTMLTMSPGALGRSDAVLEHEMAHQWFGDSVTPRDWQGLWLSEGFAMYLQQWYEVDSHRPPYAGGLTAWRGYDLQSRRSSGPPGDWNPKAFGDVNVYLGPAMMLDEIRQRVGDDAFGALLRGWAADHANENVDRQIFTDWVNRQTGRNLTALIATWLDSKRTPHFSR